MKTKKQKTNKFAYKMQRENNYLRGIIKQLTDRCRAAETTAATWRNYAEQWQKISETWKRINEELNK